MSVALFETPPMEATQISILGHTREKLHRLKNALGLPDYDSIIQELLRRSDVHEIGKTLAPDPRATLIIGVAGHTGSPKELCNSEFKLRGRPPTGGRPKIRCRRAPGHDGQHRWWNRTGAHRNWS
jgi:hypothetical protein